MEMFSRDKFYTRQDVADTWREFSGICGIITDATILAIAWSMPLAMDNEIVDALQEEESMALALADEGVDPD